MLTDDRNRGALWLSPRIRSIFHWVTLRGLIRAVSVRGASGLLLMALTACAASARPHVRGEVPPSSPAAPSASKLEIPGDSGPSLSQPPAHSAGVYHRVQSGQNLFRIAKTYGIALPELMRVNKIKDAHNVQAGLVIFIPGAIDHGSPVVRTRLAPVAPRKPATQGASVPAIAKGPPEPLRAWTPDGSTTGGLSAVQPGPQDTPLGPDQAPLGVSYLLLPPDEPFSWPVDGGVARSGFGLRHGRLHAGLDISAPGGSDVHAARDGSVVYSGHGFQGYGNVVMIDHSDGFVTVYAHNSKNLVTEGDQVVRGQTIAKVGATGNARGSHCHFEIRRGQVAVDPQHYIEGLPLDEGRLAFGNGPARSLMKLNQANIAAAHSPIP